MGDKAGERVYEFFRRFDSPYYFTTDHYSVVERDGVRTIEVVRPERLPTYPDCSGTLGIID